MKINRRDLLAVSAAGLAGAAGLAKSTAHHHLAQLRAAGLVTLRGNARGYWYSLRPEGLREAQHAIGDLVHAPPETVPALPRKRRSAGRPRMAKKPSPR